MKIPQEFIVVEGKSDSVRLQQVFGPLVKTIETNGSAIDDQVIVEIKKAQKSQGVIVLTDPDFPGQKIRQIISQAVPDAKHAYLNKNQAIGKKSFQNVGVEYADNQAIIQALNQVMTPKQGLEIQKIPLIQLMELGLIAGSHAKEKRRYLSDKLHIGYVNGKQLQKRLAMYQIDPDKLREVLENYDKK